MASQTLNMRRLRKKGSIEDIFGIMAGFFVLGFLTLIVFMFISKMDEKVQTEDVFTTEARDVSTDMVGIFPDVVDGGIVFLFFMALIASLALATLVVVHPVFFIPYAFEQRKMIQQSIGVIFGIKIKILR